jgi:dTDP-4-amino-4,6-dideoxygalactose transaminase
MEEAEGITRSRLNVWDEYHTGFEKLEVQGFVKRSFVPQDCQHNAHMYYIIVETVDIRDRLILFLKEQNINAVFHYVPLHSSPAGIKYGRISGDMAFTEDMSDRLIRLPLWVGFKNSGLVVDVVKRFFS